ncbi:MAG: Pilus assembly protein, PilO [Candidatus Omnitrophica bacterium ADurb.Bin205]|nr:MAG: Pilus assembly protein, PilO [Candidatus Omnitrophica bacterium ADurb.Bin205]
MDLSGFINKGKNQIVSIGIIILSLVIASNIYKGKVEEIENLKSQIVEENKKNEALTAINRLSEDLISYEKLLPRRDTNLSMSDITTLARDEGVKIIAIKPSGQEESLEYVKLNFELSVTAPDYDSLASFINKLESFESVYMVDRLDIDSPSYNNDKELKAELRVSAVAILK